MFFRAIIRDQQLMKDFFNTLVTLSKLTKESVMIISDKNIIFIVNEQLSSTVLTVWTELDCQSYFSEYDMKGVDENLHKNIYLSFNPSNLARALTSLRNSMVIYCKIKLTNKQFPCLSVDIELPSSNSTQSRRINHDVPITLIPRRDWSEYKIPKVPTPNISLALPSIKFIRVILDKFKNISPSITIYGTNEGELNLVAETDQATLCARYRNAQVRSTNKDNDDDVEVNENTENRQDYYESSCLIDCKKTASFLSALQVANSELIFDIVRERLIRMEVAISLGLVIHCIIPAVSV